MVKRSVSTFCIGIVVLFGILLMGQDSAAQTGLCDPDPCEGMPNAVADTCTSIPGGLCQPGDFSCDCETGFVWKDATNTCEEPRPSGPMAEIPAGCFNMGDAFSENDDDELPVHNVCISAFEMDVHEVTNAEYKACVDDGGCTAPIFSSSYTRGSYYGNTAYDDFPVIWVDWHKATDYCTWAGKRLPTEAEREYAARGGLAGKRYPWGDSISGTDANYYYSGDPWDNDTSEVEYYVPNGYGLYDLAGNVWEWVNDWFQYDYYSVSPTNDPPGPASGTYRVLRGGSWHSDSYFLRVAFRSYYYPGLVSRTIGFRCAR
jgi:formylglycine-generating enzyme required for sulfatase activity